MDTIKQNMIRLFWVAIIPFIAFTACISEDHVEKSNATGESVVRFTFRLPGSISSTRSLTEIDESHIQIIDILMFEQGGGEWKYRAGVRGSDIMTDGADEAKKTFTVTMRHGDYDLVLFANAREEISALDLEGKTKSQVLALLTNDVPIGGKWIADNGMAGYKDIPMWGEINDITIDQNTEITESDGVTLTRMVARVDVQIASTVDNFTITSVDVYNYNTKGSLAPLSSAWNPSANPPRATAPNVPTGSTLTKGPLEYNNGGGKSEINTSDNKCASEIYIFEAENHTGTAHSTGKDHLERTCIVVGGVYDANGNGIFTDDGPVTYYRADFSIGTGDAETFYDILRNHHYTFNVTNVFGPGYSTSEDAFQGVKKIEFTVMVTDWGNENKVPVTSLEEPEYFVIDHTFNTTEIHLHMVKRNQPFGHLWYTYANVPDGHNSEDVPPAGTQVSPPRKHSCASLYSKDPSNPWRLPTWEELLALRDYVLNNEGVGFYNFDLSNNAFYCSATAPVGAPYMAYMAQIYTGGTGDWAKGDLVFGSGAHARCVRGNSGSTPPTPVPALSVDVNTLLASGNEETITVTSETRWIAHIKPGTNSVTSGSATLIGQPLLSALNGGDLDQHVGGGTTGSTTVVPLKVTTMEYWNPNIASGTFTIVFRDAETGMLLKEENITVQNCSLEVVSHTVPSTIPQPGSSAYTVTFGGKIPSGYTFPVRVYDVAGSSALWTSASDGNIVARNIQINAHTVWDSPRQLQVQYYYNGAWTIALTATQSGYYITVDSHNIPASLTQPAANYTVNFSGYVPTNFQVRVWDVTANAQISTSTASVGARTVSVTANTTWATRSLRFEYSRNGVMTTIVTRNQGGYYINISSAPQVASTGGTYTVTFSGIYPALTLTALAGGSAITSATLPASTSSSGVALGISNNTTGAARALTLRVNNPSNQTFGWCTQQYSGPLSDGYNYMVSSRTSNGSDWPAYPDNYGWSIVPANTLSQADAQTILRYLGCANLSRFYWHTNNWDPRGFYYTSGTNATWSGATLTGWVHNYHNIEYIGGVPGARGTVWFIWKRNQ